MKIYFKKYLSILLVLIGIIMFLALFPILKALYVDSDFAKSVRLFIFIVFPLPILVFTCRFIFEGINRLFINPVAFEYTVEGIVISTGKIKYDTYLIKKGDINNISVYLNKKMNYELSVFINRNQDELKKNFLRYYKRNNSIDLATNQCVFKRKDLLKLVEYINEHYGIVVEV